jgi:hypothetical protein
LIFSFCITWSYVIRNVYSDFVANGPLK